MSIEVVPNLGCNIKCKYCYQDTMREAGNFGRSRIELNKIIPVIKKLNEGAFVPEFGLFGGESLLISKLTAERLWGFGLKEYEKNSIQTNGELIDEEWIRLFKRYNVSVGISVDGPWPLNEARSTAIGTGKTLRAIELLASQYVFPAVSIVLNKCNASSERLPLLLRWIKELDDRGCPEVRIHLMEVDTERGASVLLSETDTRDAFLAIHKLQTKNPLQPFLDMRMLVLGLMDKDNSWRIGCTWNGCDAYTTPAVQKMDGSGNLSNCGRTNKDGVDFVKADKQGSERVLALYVTPHEHGGCKDCRFFYACKGQCPGEGIDGDWRNRSVYCAAYLTVFEEIEKEFAVGQFELPSLSPEYAERLLKISMGMVNEPHGDIAHVDVPHVDRNVVVVPVVKK